MKASVVAAAAMLGLVSAQNATVYNSCDFDIYVQSVPYDGSKSGSLTTVSPGGQPFNEAFRRTGSTIKIAKTRTLDAPLFFGYSFSSNPDYAYYQFSTQFGNPFAGEHNELSAGPGCNSFDCKANDSSCYSTPAAPKTYGCPEPVDLVATICK